MRTLWVLLIAWSGTAYADTKDYWCVGKTCYTAEYHRPTGCDGHKGECEAGGNIPARLINGLHFFLTEANKAKHDNKQCQGLAARAALIASLVDDFYNKVIKNHDGMHGVTYITRFDGALTERKLVELAASEGKQAQARFTECGGKKLDTDLEAANQGLARTAAHDAPEAKNIEVAKIEQIFFVTCTKVKDTEECEGPPEGRGVTVWEGSYVQCSFHKGKATKCGPFTGKTAVPCHQDTRQCLCGVVKGVVENDCESAPALVKSKYIRVE
jgi:hypothetical protein